MEESTRQFEGIGDVISEPRECPCGCGQVVPVFWGNLRYNPDYEVKFVAAHLVHCDSGPHVWFRTGVNRGGTATPFPARANARGLALRLHGRRTRRVLWNASLRDTKLV